MTNTNCAICHKAIDTTELNGWGYVPLIERVWYHTECEECEPEVLIELLSGAIDE